MLCLLWGCCKCRGCKEGCVQRGSCTKGVSYKRGVEDIEVVQKGVVDILRQGIYSQLGA